MKRTGKSRILRQGMKCVAAYALALGVGLSMPMSVLAEEYDISQGNITVVAKNDGQYVTHGTNAEKKETTHTIITGTTSSNFLTIEAWDNYTANVTFKDVNINAGSQGEAAVKTSREGNVSIELDGDNILQSGVNHAGLEKNNIGILSINDNSGNSGTLNATGGERGAGIGGGNEQSVNDIEINGGTIIATGNAGSAGLGGGAGSSQNKGNATNIVIHGGVITANGKQGGAGIGGGSFSSGTEIMITGGKVEATAMDNMGGAGIGGGSGGGNGTGITISGGSVTATGTGGGAGIGGGAYGTGGDVTISGAAKVSAKAENNINNNIGASIGSGYSSTTNPGTNGVELTEGAGLDTSGLYNTGSVTRVSGGYLLKQIVGEIEPPEPEAPVAEQPKTETAFSSAAMANNSSTPAAVPYKVKIEEPENGTITADLEHAKPGDTVKVTATPDAGHVLESISVKTDDGKEVPVTEIGGGVFTFLMPNGHVTISAVFVPVKAEVSPAPETVQPAENKEAGMTEKTSEDNAALTGGGISLNILPVKLEFVKDPSTDSDQLAPVAEPQKENPPAEPVTETPAAEPVVESVVETLAAEPETEPVVEAPAAELVTELAKEPQTEEKPAEEPQVETAADSQAEAEIMGPVEEPQPETVATAPVTGPQIEIVATESVVEETVMVE